MLFSLRIFLKSSSISFVSPTEINGLTCPSVITPATNASFIASGNDKSLMVLETVGALFPTFLATSLVPKPNSSINLLYAWALSIGLRSSLCTFSTIAISSIC
ncbi:MAG: hypothetical protein ACD_37C00162G0001 [uncultured bacterium]|nr:MAG: hypothetical protein ACD_37C00162G0001 [uncultured bacterium]